jgi:hypothetical protein
LVANQRFSQRSRTKCSQLSCSCWQIPKNIRCAAGQNKLVWVAFVW